MGGEPPAIVAARRALEEYALVENQSEHGDQCAEYVADAITRWDRAYDGGVAGVACEDAFKWAARLTSEITRIILNTQ